jgi:D-alanyl-lipoteichoic acid acyltransferase DltB (MBOAT superfamily)
LLIGLGIFKKVFIADNLAQFVTPVFAPGADPSGAEVLVAGYAFLFQVYSDFSAYTDIARGTSKLMGFELMENFKTPYLARNVQDFWHRWHISLTTWIRDYLYYPLAFARFRGRSIPPALVTIITFSVMGLWHGAAWGFVMWGVYNGVVLAIFGTFSKRIRRVADAFKGNSFWSSVWVAASVLLTFHVIFVGDIFFRSGSLAQAGSMLSLLVTDFSIDVPLLGHAAVYIAPIVLLDLLTFDKPAEERVWAVPAVLRYAFGYLMCVAVVKWGAPSAQFIYSQF